MTDTVADRIMFFIGAICVGLVLAILLVIFLAAIGVVPTVEHDPCRYGGTGKTSPNYHHGWIEYGGRKVWCGK